MQCRLTKQRSQVPKTKSRHREGLIKCSGAFLGDRPSAAKAAYLAGSGGTAEAVPFPKSLENELNQRVHRCGCLSHRQRTRTPGKDIDPLTVQAPVYGGSS